jgi:hypothetical protein
MQIWLLPPDQADPLSVAIMVMPGDAPMTGTTLLFEYAKRKLSRIPLAVTEVLAAGIVL